MSNISPTVKFSFAIILVLGIGISILVTFFEEASGGYLAQVVSEEESEEVDAEVVMPIVQEVSLSSAGAYTMSGQEIYSFRPDKRWPLASITKLMTALVADRLYLTEAPYELVEITEEMVAVEGETGGLKVGEVIRADDLIKAMMLVSSNDAAAALSIHYGEEEFVLLMNKTAEELGMTNTTFVDSTGLSVQNLSTVQDVRKLVELIWNDYTYIFNISTRPRDVIINRSSGAKRNLDNTNSFVELPDFLGGKTGSVSEGDGNLVSIFSVPGREEEVAVVVFGAGDPFLETQKILEGLR